MARSCSDPLLNFLFCVIHSKFYPSTPPLDIFLPLMYILIMASLQRVRVKGHSYWRIVESRRVNGKPRLFVLAHLGKADDLLKRLQAADAFKISSRSHGSVAAVHALARELDVAGLLNQHLARLGRRDRKEKVHTPNPARIPLLHEGLTPGTSLELICIGRACHPTSKMGFTQWAKTTTLGELANVNVDLLSSQHFWDQMDQVPVEVLATAEKDIVQRVLSRFQIPLETLLYDATNFYTFIASDNFHCEIPQRGHNKQKRNDLRQVGVALLCSKNEGVPLFHQVYGGKMPDCRSFAAVLPAMRDRLIELGQDPQSLTVVYDKGNLSKANQGEVDRLGLQYVASLPLAGQSALLQEANAALGEVELGEEQKVLAYRAKRSLWGAERTLVVLVSEHLQKGQLRGIQQHLTKAIADLKTLKGILQRGKQKRDKATLERDVERRLAGRQFLREILHVKVEGEGRSLSLSYTVDEAALKRLEQTRLGRIILFTSRHEWDTPSIIAAYRGQAQIERVFEHLKDPFHLSLRPQYHWTDQKLHVHAFTCLVGYLLVRLLHFKAKQEIGYARSQEALLDTLERVRKVRVIRAAGNKGLRVQTHLEEMDPEGEKLVKLFGITG